jgi:hypothetical protein
MSRIRLFHAGEYYRLSIEPSSFEHLNITLKKTLSLSLSTLEYIDKNKLSKVLANEEDYKLLLSSSPEEILIYINGIPSDLLDYEDLKTSSILAVSQDIASTIRKELQSSNLSIVHIGHSCEVCKIEPIVGIRYYCNYCKISLCEICEPHQAHPHDLLKLKKIFMDHKKQKFGRIVFDAVRKVKELGFQDDKKIRDALVQAGYNVEIALSILIGDY